MNAKQPPALFLLFFVEMWERFSYYGMRVLLVLFMVERLGMSDSRAFGVYALYTALVEIGAVVGGYVSDRILGLRRAILLGGGLIALGHICLTFERGEFPFFVGLGLIVSGSMLFISNIKALLGLFYSENDPRREAGFTLFYMGINVGGFLAALVCGFAAQTFGWHAGFGLAAAGMFLGLGTLVGCRRFLETRGEAPRDVSLLKQGAVMVGALVLPLGLGMAFKHPGALMPFLPVVGVATLIYIALKVRGEDIGVRRAVAGVVGLTCLLMVFFSFEELMGSVLVLFTERYVDRSIFSHVIPSSVLMAINPLTVIVLGALLSKGRREALKSSGVAFLLLGGAFVALLIGGLIAGAGGSVSVAFVAGSFFLIATGELFIAPTLFALCSEVAPRGMRGVLMALVVMGFSYASLLSGVMGQAVAKIQERGGEGLGTYCLFFAIAAAVCIAVAGGVVWVRGRLGASLVRKFLKFKRMLVNN